MTKLEIINSVSRTVNKLGFALKKHGPDILVVGGTIATVAGAVLACKATTKLPEVTEKAKENVATIKAVAEAGKLADGTPYDDKDYKKDLTITYVRTGVDLAKLYGPSVIIGAAGLGCILKSHNIMRGRNMALAAAYATVDKSFKEYRGRLVERFGDELDKELKYNIKTKEVEEVVVDEEGNETTVKKTVKTIDNPNPSEFAIFFDEYCEGWTKSPDANKTFLMQQERWANERLQAKGHLFLNEVYDMLGAQRTQAGNIVGWKYDPRGIDCGDNFVSFGIFDQCGLEKYDERKRAFVNGHERSILLDFNVDGDIFHDLP